MLYSSDYFDVDDRMLSEKMDGPTTTRRPMIYATRKNQIEQNVAVPSIRSIFPETWIFDLIDDTTLGYL